jgi:hypothetical protein
MVEPPIALHGISLPRNRRFSGLLPQILESQTLEVLAQASFRILEPARPGSGSKGWRAGTELPVRGVSQRLKSGRRALARVNAARVLVEERHYVLGS